MSVSNINNQTIVNRFIECDPMGDGADARITGRGIPVWALVGDWLANGRDIDLVASGYQLPREAVQAALACYERHRDIIDARMQANVVQAE